PWTCARARPPRRPRPSMRIWSTWAGTSACAASTATPRPTPDRNPALPLSTVSRSSGPTPRTTPAARRAPDMCGRFAFFQEIQPLLDDLDAVDLTDGRLRSRWNIPPTTPLHVATESLDQSS